MSSFFGIFRPQGGSVNLEAFEDMRKASERDGFDVMSTHVEDKIAMGYLMLRVSPEDQDDHQPLTSSCGRYLLVGHFRLDYRDDLGDKIGLIQSQLEKTPDSAIALMAFQKWGQRCVHHMEGDFAFAIYDGLIGVLSLLKDRFGSSALFYGKLGSDFIFSTDPCLFTKMNNRYNFELNENAFFRTGIKGLGLESGETYFDHVFSLECSCIVSVDEKLHVQKYQYYKIPSIKIRYSFCEDYIFQFHSFIHQSVSNRLRASRVGLFLSAGLDSSMVAYFAAKEMEYQKRRLSTFTSYPYHIGHINAEKQLRISEHSFVERNVSALLNIDPNFFNFPDLMHSQLIDSNKFNNILNPVISSNSFWLDGINNAASKNGIKRMLNGQMGNYIVSWNAPFSSLDYLFRFRLLALYKTLKYINTIRKTSIIDFLVGELAKPFYQFIKNRISRLGYLIFKIGLDVSFLKFDKRKIKVDFSKQFHSRFSTLIGPKRLRLHLFESNMTNVGQRWYVQANEHAVQSADPFTDLRLVEYSFSIPELLYNFYGDKKFIYKKLMQGVIDSDMLSRLSGMPQSYDIGRRLQSDKPFVQMIEALILQKSFPDDFDYAGVEKMLSVLRSTDQDSLMNKNATELLKFISLHLFLSKFVSNRISE
jgi:asparagine synthase (glutamine-hydrolysing)